MLAGLAGLAAGLTAGLADGSFLADMPRILLSSEGLSIARVSRPEKDTDCAASAVAEGPSVNCKCPTCPGDRAGSAVAEEVSQILRGSKLVWVAVDCRKRLPIRAKFQIGLLVT